MTLLVRNEQDVIAENILFHHRQGVDAFIVMDNLSSDATVDIVRDLAHSIPIELRHQQDDTYNQTVWVTEMARAAASDHGADWVINNDADEFWMFPDFDAHHYLNSFADDVSGVVLKRHNAVLIENEVWDGFDAHPCSPSCLSSRLNQLGSPLPKCLHRASTQVTVQQGKHSVSGLPGQTVHRDRARIPHFPYRGFSSTSPKSGWGAAYARNTQLQANVGRTWREQHKIVDQPSWPISGKGFSDLSSAACRGLCECFREPRLRQELGRLIEAWQQQQLQRSAQPLLASTSMWCVISRLESVVGDLNPLSPAAFTTTTSPFWPRARCSISAVWRLAGILQPRESIASLHAAGDLVSLFPRNDALLD